MDYKVFHWVSWEHELVLALGGFYLLLFLPAADSFYLHVCTNQYSTACLRGAFCRSQECLHSSELCLANSGFLGLLHLSACLLSSERLPVYAWDPHFYSDTRLGQLKCSPHCFAQWSLSSVAWHPASENHCFIYFVQVFSCFSWEVIPGLCYSNFARNRSNTTFKIFFLPLSFCICTLLFWKLFLCT